MTAALGICLAMQLQLVNDAKIPSDVLDAVRRETTAIYASAGIQVRWHDGPQSATPARRFIVKIIPHPIASVERQPHVMGAALRDVGGTLVYVFYGRVEGFARARRVRNSTMLAHVIAHEVGHLLLPKGWHAQQGLMRATWDTAHISNAVHGTLTFTSEEIQWMRDILFTGDGSRCGRPARGL